MSAAVWQPSLAKPGCVAGGACLLRNSTGLVLLRKHRPQAEFRRDRQARPSASLPNKATCEPGAAQVRAPCWGASQPRRWGVGGKGCRVPPKASGLIPRSPGLCTLRAAAPAVPPLCPPREATLPSQDVNGSAGCSNLGAPGLPTHATASLDLASLRALPLISLTGSQGTDSAQ